MQGFLCWGQTWGKVRSPAGRPHARFHAKGKAEISGSGSLRQDQSLVRISWSDQDHAELVRRPAERWSVDRDTAAGDLRRVDRERLPQRPAGPPWG